MLHLHGLGHFHPKNVLDNAFFESLDIGTNDAWIVSRVGIRTRRTVLPLDYIRETRNRDLRASEEAAVVSNAEAGKHAAEMAIARAGISAEDIGMVVAGGCSPVMCIPAEAATVAQQLAIEVPCFDMHAACSTFAMQLHFLAAMGDNLPDYVLALCIENNTRVCDYTDRSTSVLWGDGTSAAVVSTKHPGKAKVAFSSFGGAPSGSFDVIIPRIGHFWQDGSKVQKFAIKRMVKLFGEARDKAEKPEEVVYVGHQANLTMLKSVAKRIKVGEQSHWFNIDQFGNQGSAGAPIVLSQRWDEVPRGTSVGVTVVGSGLSWSSALLSFD